MTPKHPSVPDAKGRTGGSTALARHDVHASALEQAALVDPAQESLVEHLL